MITHQFDGCRIAEHIIDEHRTLVAPCMPALRYLLPGGLFIGNAYGLVISAMQWLPAAYVVALTNAGIILAGVLSMTLFAERENWRGRLAALLVLAVGLGMIRTAAVPG